RDPEGWNAETYMRELMTVPNRGYSYAFHEGRLTNHSHGYEHTATLAESEYAGVIIDVTDDAFIFEAKNRLLAGGVLEFIPPSSAAPVLLRMYDFERADSGARSVQVNPGHESILRIPFALFELEDPAQLAARLPPMSIARKEK